MRNVILYNALLISIYASQICNSVMQECTIMQFSLFYKTSTLITNHVGRLIVVANNVIMHFNAIMFIELAVYDSYSSMVRSVE